MTQRKSVAGNYEAALIGQMKKTPEITVSPMAAYQNGNVVWGYGDFMFPDGPSGHYGDHGRQRRRLVAYRLAHL